jgi:hypothetical protein
MARFREWKTRQENSAEQKVSKSFAWPQQPVNTGNPYNHGSKGNQETSLNSNEANHGNHVINNIRVGNFGNKGDHAKISNQNTRWNYVGFHVKYLLFLYEFNQIWNFLHRYS